MHRGYIKIWRKFEDSGIFKNLELFGFATYLIAKANHKTRKTIFSGGLVTIERGQLVTGRLELSKNTGLSSSKVYRYLSTLKNIDFLDIKSNNKYSIITICNYDKYQNSEIDFEQQTEQQSDNKPDSQRTASEQPANTSKECNTLSIKEDIILVFDFWQSGKALIHHQNLTLSMKKVIQKRLSEFSKDDLFKAIDNYNEVLSDHVAYWYTYRHTFEDFFRNGIQKEAPFKKFLPEARPLENFKCQARPKVNETPGADRTRTGINEDPSSLGECLSFLPAPQVKVESKENILRRARGKLNAGVFITESEYQALPENEREPVFPDEEFFKINHEWRYQRKISEPVMMAENGNG